MEKRIKDEAAALAELEKAQAVLKDRPDDPEANSFVGRTLCIIYGDWEQALPHLAKGSDPAVKTLAQHELAAVPSGTDEQVKRGDSWWDLAQRRSGREKDAFLIRAAIWYEAAKRDLPEGLMKVKVEKRLAETAVIERPAVPSKKRAPVDETRKPPSTDAAPDGTPRADPSQ